MSLSLRERDGDKDGKREEVRERERERKRDRKREREREITTDAEQQQDRPERKIDLINLSEGLDEKTRNWNKSRGRKSEEGRQK